MDLVLEIFGFLIGILYLWWEYHANPRLWFASMVMPAISMWIYFSKGLYADFGINIYYFIIAIYGYIVWTRRHSASPADDKALSSKTSAKEIPISHTPALTAVGTAGVFLAVWGLIYFILVRFTNSNVPVCDSFTTALSIIASWMLARKYVEQWIAWVIVDAVCVGLYIYKGIYFYATLYAIYTIVAIFGYFKWLRMMKA